MKKRKELNFRKFWVQAVRYVVVCISGAFVVSAAALGKAL